MPDHPSKQTFKPELKSPQTQEEWKAYHTIREEVLWLARGRTDYDPHHPDDKKPENHPLLYVFQEKAMGVARLDVDGSIGFLRRVAIRHGSQRRGHGRQFLLLIEKFARAQDIQFIRSNVAPDATGFYLKMAYQRIGQPTGLGSIPMEKTIASSE